VENQNWGSYINPLIWWRILKMRRLEWFGHVIRMGQRRMVKKIF
jgi:hypothetical protein